MPIDRSDILAALARLQLPDGGDLVSRDFIRAVVVEGEAVRFVIEAPTPEVAHKLADIRAAAEQIVMQPADDYVADFVAGISRLKVVHADAVMQSLEAYT
ncbi:iron-sulfur cluster assembly protein, partial [Planktomarina temperata]|uniref:iron-sulfur cluster assembly protein n=1 Tax=Planktomarina temperata TaxID=1284658 RepID=UPI0033079B46